MPHVRLQRQRRAAAPQIAGSTARPPLQVHTASCLLVVVNSVEGAGEARGLALRLVLAALDATLTDLSAELLRFLYPACDLDAVSLHPHGARSRWFVVHVRARFALVHANGTWQLYDVHMRELAQTM
jgi:hypothetical protein